MGSLLVRKDLNFDGSYIWVVRFLFLFTLGRVTRITLANNSLDLVLHDIYFFIIFVGVNVTFFPIHQIGILGMPRRYFSYGELYLTLNIVTFIGTLFTMLG